jgi:transcriptional regulator GlxA family with amidase domain
MMLKVVFHPGAMYRIFGVPLALITDQYVDAQSVIGNEIKTVNEQMANAGAYQQIINIAEAYLWKKVQKSKIVTNPVSTIGQLLVENPTRFSLDWLASQACWSPRQLERQFMERMGVSPKFLARISRFDKVFSLKQINPSLDWLSIALQTGYNDYQHLVKDFKQFAGVTPNVMMQAEKNSPERVLGIVTDHIPTR